MDGLIPGYANIRKRGCSSSPSSSSKVNNYRFKRAIVVGKTRAGGGSRFSTPAPSWRIMPTSTSKPSGGDLDSSDCHGGGGRSRPVSARKLAATLWEVNEMPSSLQRRRIRVKDKQHTPGSIPPNLSDPSHSPVSKIETRCQAQIANGFRARLKQVSNGLTTSKELLKIIHRMWAHDNIPSSSMSLISALHSELERARLQVNHIIKDQQVDHKEVNHLLKLFAEEKELWKSKERRAIEQLEIEKRLRRRSESLNKKLGQELAETKASFAKVLKEIAREKQGNVIMDQVCVDRAEAEVMKCKSVKSHEEMLQLADKLREERVQMKLTEAKHHFEEKSALVDKLRSQVETVVGNMVTGKNAGRIDEDLSMHLQKYSFNGTRLIEDDGEVEDDKDLVDDEIKWRNFINELVNGKALRRSSCSIQNQKTFAELEKHTPRRSHGDDLLRFKSVKGLRDRILTKLKSRDFDDSGHRSGSNSRGETFSGGQSKN